MFGAKVFCVGRCNASCLGILFFLELINYFLKIRVVLVTVWHWLTVEEAEAEAMLVAADALAVRRWWLEERRLVVVCQLVKTAAVCLSAGSSALRVCS